MRRMFSSRSSAVKPRFLFRPWRTLSPSSSTVTLPIAASACSSVHATVDLPLPLRPAGPGRRGAGGEAVPSLVLPRPGGGGRGQCPEAPGAPVNHTTTPFWSISDSLVSRGTIPSWNLMLVALPTLYTAPTGPLVTPCACIALPQPRASTDAAAWGSTVRPSFLSERRASILGLWAVGYGQARCESGQAARFWLDKTSALQLRLPICYAIAGLAAKCRCWQRADRAGTGEF